MRDEHSHIIWDVDDGSTDRAMTSAMLQEAKLAGVTELWCTPHMRWDDFDQQLVQERYAILKEEAAALGITTRLGYEVYYKTLLRQGLHTAPRYVLEGTDHLLLEFNSGGEVPHDFFRNVYRLQSEYGLEITLAHPERYASCVKDFSLVHKIKEAGCRIQISAEDLNLGIFNPVSKCAKRIIKEGLADALVSDAHCPEHYKLYAKLYRKYWK